MRLLQIIAPIIPRDLAVDRCLNDRQARTGQPAR
jgi:hypothetical protein